MLSIQLRRVQTKGRDRCRDGNAGIPTASNSHPTSFIRSITVLRGVYSAPFAILAWFDALVLLYCMLKSRRYIAQSLMFRAVSCGNELALASFRMFCAAPTLPLPSFLSPPRGHRSCPLRLTSHLPWRCHVNSDMWGEEVRQG